MKSKLLLLLLVFSINVIPFNQASAQIQQGSSDKQVFDMLKKFYVSYITEISDGTDERKANLIKSQNCTTGLLSKIEKQFKTGKLDYDPFLKAQDSDVEDLKTLTITKAPQKSNVFTVTYIDKYTKNKIVINLIVVKQNGIYKIDAIW